MSMAQIQYPALISPSRLRYPMAASARSPMDIQGDAPADQVGSSELTASLRRGFQSHYEEHFYV